MGSPLKVAFYVVHFALEFHENIRIEDAQEKLVDIKILDSKYSLDRVRGEVEDVYFRNITVRTSRQPTMSMPSPVTSRESTFTSRISTWEQAPGTILAEASAVSAPVPLRPPSLLQAHILL